MLQKDNKWAIEMMCESQRAYLIVYEEIPISCIRKAEKDDPKQNPIV